MRIRELLPLKPFNVADFARFIVACQPERLGYQSAICFIHAMRIDYPMRTAGVVLLKKPNLIGPCFALFRWGNGLAGIGDTGEGENPKEQAGREN